MRQQALWIALLTATILAAPVALADTFAPDQYQQAVDDYRAGRYKQAYVAFKSLHQKEPGNTRATYYLAMTEVQLGWFSEAREHYGEVLTLAPASKEAELASEGLSYLPANNPLDAPPRPVITQQADNNNSNSGGLMGLLKKPSQAKPSQAEPTQTQNYPGYFEPKAVSASYAQQQQQQAGNAYPHYGNTGGMSPQDLMAMQMMMGGNSNNNNLNPMNNPMMMMYGMPQQGYDPNNPQQGSQMQQMDPNIMSTMMMNQMLNNFSFMDGSNKDK